MVSTTSLTVHPKAFFTRFTAGSETDEAAKLRSGVSGPLMEVCGALNGDGGGVMWGWRFCSRILRATLNVRRAARAARTGCWASDQVA